MQLHHPAQAGVLFGTERQQGGFQGGGLSFAHPLPCQSRLHNAVHFRAGSGLEYHVVQAMVAGPAAVGGKVTRHGNLFTWEGKINLLNEKYMEDDRPISKSCACPACSRYSRAYIRHLFKAKEALGMRLAVLHNLYFYNELMQKIRDALDEGRFEEFYHKYHNSLAERCKD